MPINVQNRRYPLLKTITIEAGQPFICDGERCTAKETHEIRNDGTIDQDNGEFKATKFLLEHDGDGLEIKIHPDVLAIEIFRQPRKISAENATALRVLYPGDLGFNLEKPIRASTKDDHHEFIIDFDARLWLEQADDDDITKLHECHYHTNDAAEDVAAYYIQINPQLSRMFREKRDGFYVEVNAYDVEEWLLTNNKPLAEKLNLK